MLYSDEHECIVWGGVKQQLNKILPVLGLDTVKYAYAHQ